MTVEELIAELQEFDPKMKVRIPMAICSREYNAPDVNIESDDYENVFMMGVCK